MKSFNSKESDSPPNCLIEFVTFGCSVVCVVFDTFGVDFAVGGVFLLIDGSPW